MEHFDVRCAYCASNYATKEFSWVYCSQDCYDSGESDFQTEEWEEEEDDD